MNELRGEREARIREMTTWNNSLTDQRETLTSLASNTAQIRRDVNNVATNISVITLRVMSELHSILVQKNAIQMFSKTTSNFLENQYLR